MISNMVAKSDVGTVSFGADGAGPHAATLTSGGDVFTLDAEGSRVLADDSVGGGTVTLGGLWERTVTNGVIVDVSHYAGPDGEAAMAVHEAGADTVVVPFTDNLGSTVASWDTSTGVVDRQRYYPYGEIRQSDGLDTAVGFTGQRHDPSGLMYYQARYYDPHIGRFTQPDTIIPGGGANPQALNRYTYVNNNPTNYTDPTGHECFVGGERDGQCFEGPDGADWAMTAGEEAATVKIMTPAGVMLPDGSLQVSENIRFTKFGDLSSEQIWASHRYATDVNGVTDFAEFADQLVLDQCGCRIDFGNVSLRALWRVGSTIVVVGCIAATSGACTAVVYVIAAANVAISYVDNDIGRGSSGCQKGNFAVDVIANAMPIAAVKFTTGAAAMDGIETLNTAVHNSAGLSIGASGLDYCGLGG